MKKHLKKIVGLGLGAFVLLGIVNAFVIGHDSQLDGKITYVKGLDEMYGDVQPGRILATNSSWKKIESTDFKNTVAQADFDHSQGEAPAAIDEELKLDLVEVINPKLWSRGLPSSDFEGDLETSSGRISSLSINLPGREEISISFAEMNGNVFQYDYAGEIYSGMLYQVDPKSFMVTLTNGPLEGTRLRFVEGFSSEQIEIKETLKEEHNVEVGFFGENPKQPKETKKEKKSDPSMVEVQMINMGAQV
ncbi:MAG: hypothetical protein V4598_15710 [Bdellovibrionota bacterium]